MTARSPIVTGGARGLGRAYAHRLASLGAKVAVTDHNLKSYEEFAADAKTMTGDTTVDEIKALGGESLGFEFDISDRAAVFEMADAVAKAWGTVSTSWWRTPAGEAARRRKPPRLTCRNLISKW